MPGRLLCLGWMLMCLPVHAFDFRDQERIVLIGSTFIEREQRSGYWEAALVAALPEKSLVVRNLGWSGDTVWGEARAGFDSPAEGYKRLVDHVREEKPTLIIVGYGTNEAFDGSPGLPRFREQLNRLLDDLSSTNARFILLSPIHLVPFPGVPAPDDINASMDRYTDVIRETAARRNALFLDLRDWAKSPSEALTENGMHLSERGYQQTAGRLLEALGLSSVSPLAEDRMEKLRRLVVQKNELYFHRWRPQNITYLFGFRKHEQGQNAREIAEFDPLIAAKEREIEQSKRSKD